MSGAFKLLPLLIMVAILSFSVRLTEVFTGISNISSTAFAEAKPAPKNEPKKSPEAEVKEDIKPKDESKKEDVEIVDSKKAKSPKWKDASDADIGLAGVKFELFKDLSKRRDMLDAQEKDINNREALLKAAEQELARKYQELSKLRNEIEGLLKSQSEEEDKRINSLVKIYEGMKPKDSARIFDTLDLDVLLAVISRMSERKVSPVLAAMNPERVRTITIMLAEQKTLPTLR